MVPLITQEQINTVVNRIVESAKPEKVIIFGSYAYGQPDENSDLDILVIKNTNTPQFQRTREIRKHLRGLAIPIDIVVYTPQEINEWKDTQAAFITQIVKYGKVIYIYK